MKEVAFRVEEVVTPSDCTGIRWHGQVNFTPLWRGVT